MMKLMSKYILSLFFFGALLACGNNEEVIPEGVMDKAQLIDVMVDVELTQALIKFRLSHKDTLNQDHFFNKVYENHNTSEEEFNNSLAFYSKDPKELEGLYVEVITAISEKQAQDQ